MSEIEFLPERVRCQRQRQRRLVRAGWLLGACAAAMAALTYARHGRIAEARAAAAALSDRAANVRHQAGMLAPLQRQLADLMVSKRIDAELGSRTGCPAVLAELCRLTPENVVLVSLELKPVQVRPGADGSGDRRHRSSRAAAAAAAEGGDGPVRRQQLLLTGMAPTDVDVANFIGQLSASCLFQDVNLSYARTAAYRGRSAREFRASCYLVK
jgi:Tfp pilus assembly protein PilN